MYVYTAQSIVNLPRLSAADTQVLVTELLTVATGQEQALSSSNQTFPTSISRAKTRLTTAYQELAIALVPIPAADSQVKKSADLILDRAWSALHDLVTAWTKLPEPLNQYTDKVASLDALIFSEGLAFLNLDFKSEWQQSQSRLDAIAAQGHQQTLALIGGLVFLEHIRRAHADYGQVLGITAVKTEENSPAVREKMYATQNALRDYINKVVAWADPEEPGSEALAEALLAPVCAWEVKAAASPKATTEEGESVEPVPEAVPAAKVTPEVSAGTPPASA